MTAVNYYNTRYGHRRRFTNGSVVDVQIGPETNSDQGATTAEIQVYNNPDRATLAPTATSEWCDLESSDLSIVKQIKFYQVPPDTLLEYETTAAALTWP